MLLLIPLSWVKKMRIFSRLEGFDVTEPAETEKPSAWPGRKYRLINLHAKSASKLPVFSGERGSCIQLSVVRPTRHVAAADGAPPMR